MRTVHLTENYIQNIERTALNKKLIPTNSIKVRKSSEQTFFFSKKTMKWAIEIGEKCLLSLIISKMQAQTSNKISS